MEQMTLSHGTISYHQAGQGDPLLLIHGWGGSSRYWQKTVQHFSQQYCVYAPDLPGYGASPPMNGDINGERFADILKEFIERHNIETCHLVAHSFGSSVAALFAARWPERVRSLVLTCFSTFHNEFERRLIEQMLNQMGVSLAMWQPWMSFWHPWMGVWQSWMSLWRSQTPGSIPSIYQTIAWRFFYTIPSDDRLLRESMEDFLQMDQRTSLQTIFSALSPTIPETFQQIVTPTLLVATRQDMIMPQYGAEAVEQLIPDCRLVWIDQCGHVPMIEKPATYHQLLQTFFQSLDFSARNNRQEE